MATVAELLLECGRNGPVEPIPRWNQAARAKWLRRWHVLRLSGKRRAQLEIGSLLQDRAEKPGTDALEYDVTAVEGFG